MRNLDSELYLTKPLIDILVQNSYTRNRSGTQSGSVSGNNCTVNVSTNCTTILTQTTTTTTQSSSNSSNTTICSSNNISQLITRKKSRRNSSDITNKDSPIPSPASTTSSDSKGMSLNPFHLTSWYFVINYFSYDSVYVTGIDFISSYTSTNLHNCFAHNYVSNISIFIQF